MRKREDRFQGQAIGEFPCSQPKEGLTIAGEKGVYFLKKIIPVGVKGEEWIIKISLKDAVGAIHRAIGDGVDYMVPAADMVGGSWTGF